MVNNIYFHYQQRSVYNLSTMLAGFWATVPSARLLMRSSMCMSFAAIGLTDDGIPPPALTTYVNVTCYVNSKSPLPEGCHLNSLKPPH